MRRPLHLRGRLTCAVRFTSGSRPDLGRGADGRSRWPVRLADLPGTGLSLPVETSQLGRGERAGGAGSGDLGPAEGRSRWHRTGLRFRPVPGRPPPVGWRRRGHRDPAAARAASHGRCWSIPPDIAELGHRHPAVTAVSSEDPETPRTGRARAVPSTRSAASGAGEIELDPPAGERDPARTERGPAYASRGTSGTLDGIEGWRRAALATGATG